MCATVVETLIPGVRQLTRRINIAKKHIGNGITSLRAEEPCLQNSRYLLGKRHSDGITTDVDIHQTGIDSQECLDEFALTIGQLILLAVVTLTILEVTLVQTSEEDDDISLLGFFHSLSSQLSLRTGLAKAATYRHAIKALDGITHIATSVVDGRGLTAEG